LTRNAAEAEDLLQDTLTRGWLFWRRFEAGSNLAAWLRRIMLNLYLSRYQRTKRAHAVLKNVAVFAEQAAESMRADLESPSGLREALIASLAALPAPQREMFWAVYACDMSYQQAAATFACPVGTVMSRLHRTRRSLQRSLKSVAADHGLA
jgi:RNA polymerase sigma-70 factor (ECF subfamily)